MGYLTDASYKQAQAEVYGQLATSAVATGSQLVAFSGFSNSNYVREAYSADLDFGTGEWSASAWVNVPAYFGAPTTGAELVTNGNFDVDVSNWGLADPSASIGWQSGGTAIVSMLGNTGSGAYIDIPTSVAYVRVSIRARKIGSSSNTYLQIYRNGTFSTPLASTTILSSNMATYDFTVATGGSGIRVYLKVEYSGAQLEVDSVSVKEATYSSVVERSFSSGSSIKLGITPAGYLQATASDGVTTRAVTTDAAYNTGTWLKVRANYQAGKLAILVNGVEVKSTVGAPLLSLDSRYNLLTYTEQFDNAAVWTTYGSLSITPNYAISPIGTTTATRIVSTGGVNSRYQSYTYPSLGASYIFSVWVKATGANSTFRIYANGNVISGDLTATSTWQRFSVTVSSAVYGVNTQGITRDSAGNAFDILAWGAQLETGSTAKTYQRVGAATDFDFKAPLTIGNNYAANAPFPGSIALLKFSATVPSTEQSIWMYEQEKQMFREGAQVALPDANAIQDLAYDDLTDRWIAVSTTNKSTWSGLVRTASEAVSAGSYIKTSAASGIQLVARSTTNPGVDITIPAYNVKSRTKKKAEKSKKLSNATAIYDFTPVVFSNATLTNGSNVMTVTTANTSGTPYIGMGITGTGIAAGTTIVGIVSGTPNSYYLSAAYTGTTGSTYTVGQSTFSLPVGYTARLVYSGGLIQREGSTKAFTRTFDGFRETIVFGTSPGTSVVQIHATKQ